LEAEYSGGFAGTFEGLESVEWWQQLAREEAGGDEDVDVSSAEEHEPLEAECEAAAQQAMRAATGGRAHYGDLTGRRVLGSVASAWGSAAKPGLATAAAKAEGRGSRRSRRERRRGQPQQSSGVGCSEYKPAGSRFAVLAEAESDEETPAQPAPGVRFAVLAEEESEEETLAQPALGVQGGVGDPTRTQQSNFSEAEAEKELLELLNGWVHSCPVARGSTRQEACEEIEARLSWLPMQARVHPGAAWKAAVERHVASCEEVLMALRRHSSLAVRG
jgi:hypothetical protein